MKYSGRILLVVSLSAVLWAAAAVCAWATDEAEALPPPEAYITSEGCKKCHEDKYNAWKRTYHSTAVQKVEDKPDAIMGDFDQTGIGFSKEDVEYTIGAHWNQRYMKEIDDDYYILPKLWSISSQRWEPYNVWGWRKMPYSKFCVGCHATRYDPVDNSYVEHTIGCEVCHGPGREHADAGGDIDKIIHPNKLGSVEMELICASCHVRGLDNSGQYHFPVGYVAGRDLTKYYTPTKMIDGEAKGDAFLRLFRKWWSNVGSADSECEVCGIFGDRGGREPKTVTDYCMSCHKYNEKYPEHTFHKAEVTLECADCHYKVEVVIDEEDEEDDEDVHSVSYFLVHKKTCYDRDYTTACSKCHENFTADSVERQLGIWLGRDSIHD